MYAVGVGVVIAGITFWNEWSAAQRLVALVFMLWPLHVWEERQYPGGLHYRFNAVFKLGQLDPYPMSTFTDMITNLGGRLFGIVLLCIGATTAMIVTFLVFSIAQLVLHTIFGVQMYLRFRDRGKRTIDGPGSVTAYLGFGSIAYLTTRFLDQTELAALFVHAKLAMQRRLIGDEDEGRRIG